MDSAPAANFRRSLQAGVTALLRAMVPRLGGAGAVLLSPLGDCPPLSPWGIALLFPRGCSFPRPGSPLSQGAALLSPSLPGLRCFRTWRGFLGSRLTSSLLALTPSRIFFLRSVKQRCLNEQKRRRQRATKKISIFIGSFVICFGPYIITRLVSPVGVGSGCPVMCRCPGVLQLILGGRAHKRIRKHTLTHHSCPHTQS